MCTRREGSIAGALGHSLLALTLLRRGERRECDAQILLRCGERRECDAQILLRCGGVQQPKILLDLSCARRDRVAVHALGCGCAAAQRDARGRGVCFFLTSRRLATLASCTCGRAVPAVGSRTALRLRIPIYNAHCNAGLVAERGQVLLIARRLQHKRWHSAVMQRRWSLSCTSEGGAATRKSMREGICGACVL